MEYRNKAEAWLEKLNSVDSLWQIKVALAITYALLSIAEEISKIHGGRR